MAAYLLQQEGWEVIGVTLKVWTDSCLARASDKCCGPGAIADARQVAAALGIPHYVLDESEVFERVVVNRFISAYQEGKTPNPCTVCNQSIKFGRLLGKARLLGASYVATGHYARIQKSEKGSLLLRAVDREKDQSYFLFRLNQHQLSSILFPLGELTKCQVRHLAREAGLKVHDKEESQEICFVPGKDYKRFLLQRLGRPGFRKGPIFSKEGRWLGWHEGIECYTVGQRKGLPGGQGRPLYVLEIVPETHALVVGYWEDLFQENFWVEDVVWITQEPAPGTEVEIKIRHNVPPTLGWIFPERGKNRVKVKFETPQPAVSPGQAAVFYQGDIVLGGGWIERPLSQRTWQDETPIGFRND